MSQFLQDLQNATQMFKENAQGLAIQRSIAKANEAVQQIKAAEGDEMQKRAQLRQVSEAFVMDMSAVGAPAERIAQVAGAIYQKPQMFQTAEQAVINPELATPNQVAGAQKQITDERAYKKGLQDDQLASAERIAGMKADAKYTDDERQRLVPGYDRPALTKQDSKRVKELVGNINPARQNITRLLTMLDTPANKISPSMRAQAQTLARMTMGQLRLAIIGPGAVSDSERKILEDIVRDPTAIFNIPAAARSALSTLDSSLDRKLKTEAYTAGLIDNPDASPQAPGAQPGQAPKAPSIPGLKPIGR